MQLNILILRYQLLIILTVVGLRVLRCSLLYQTILKSFPINGLFLSLLSSQLYIFLGKIVKSLLQFSILLLSRFVLNAHLSIKLLS